MVFVTAPIYCVHESRVSGFTRRSGLLPLAARLARRHYPALQGPNVEVITDSIRELKPHGVVTADGRERQVDAVIFATGFKAQEPFERGTVFGRGGVDIVDAWRVGPEAYLGTTVNGFPNFFMLVGPNTGLGHNSMVYMIESQITYVMSVLRQMSARGLAAVDVRAEVQRAYNDELRTRQVGTVWASGCRSWYLDENGRNTTLWPGATFTFRRRTRRFRLRDYLAEARKSETGELSGSKRAPR